MNTYYLQLSPNDNRLIIDVDAKPKHEIKETVEAESWVEAKNKLGYTLTKRQENMLP